MLRITEIRDDCVGPVLKLEGKLLGPWIDELHEACRLAGDNSVPVRLDLDGLSFVDAAGILAIRGLMRRGVVIATSSLFVRELLREN
jgi:anti-anti-sigma regulatory factor